MRSAKVNRTLAQVGRRIAELRHEAALTQEGLAESTGLTPRYVQRLEAGGVNVTVDTLVKVATALHVGIPELFVMPVRPRAKPGRPRRATAASSTAPTARSHED